MPGTVGVAHVTATPAEDPSRAVTIDLFDESKRAPAGLVRIEATIYVERESQRGIVVGKGGSMLKEIGSEARASIERLLGSPVYLKFTVRVEPQWTERPEALRKLGYQ